MIKRLNKFSGYNEFSRASDNVIVEDDHVVIVENLKNNKDVKKVVLVVNLKMIVFENDDLRSTDLSSPKIS